MDRYDKNKDGVITFQDFSNEIMTRPQSDYAKNDEKWKYRQFTRRQISKYERMREQNQ